MTNRLGIETAVTQGRETTRAVRALLTLSLLACGAWTYRVTFDLLKWREQSHLARAAAANQRLDLDARTDGIVGAARDARLTISVLREIQQGGGDAGKQAAIALQSIEESLR